MHRSRTLIVLVASVGAMMAGCRSSPPPAPTPVESLPARNEPVTLYRVQAGDSPWKIAEKFYGDGGKAHWILNANPGIDPTKLQVGEVVRVPKPSHVTKIQPEQP